LCITSPLTHHDDHCFVNVVGVQLNTNRSPEMLRPSALDPWKIGDSVQLPQTFPMYKSTVFPLTVPSNGSSVPSIWRFAIVPVTYCPRWRDVLFAPRRVVRR
jgi:hypothetical protein